MPKRIVVIGGSGFIGSHLAMRLLEESYEVCCVDTHEASSAFPLREAARNGAFRFVRHNIVHPFTIQCDGIVNLAAPALSLYNKALPVETLKVCFTGSIYALDTARTERARVVYASSCDVYGVNSRALSSFGGLATQTASSPLAEGKRGAEALHRAYHDEWGVDVRIARIFNTYGDKADLKDRHVVMQMIVAALQNRPLRIYGTGEQMRTFCWVGDVVEGLVRLLKADPVERMLTVDLGSGHEISIRALAEKIIALTGSKSTIHHVGARPHEVLRRIPDLSAAYQELGWSPDTSLTEGLCRTIRYVEKELSAQSVRVMTWAEMS